MTKIDSRVLETQLRKNNSAGRMCDYIKASDVAKDHRLVPSFGAASGTGWQSFDHRRRPGNQILFAACRASAGKIRRIL